MAVTEITEATVVVERSERPPAAIGEPVALPYAPRGNTAVPTNSVIWFRMAYAKDPSVAEPAIYIWRHNVSAEVFLNGERISGETGTPRFKPIGWNHPILIPVPAAALGENNVIHVRIDVGDFGGMLSSVLVGERASLQERYDNRYFWQVETSRWGFIVITALGIFSLALWLRRRQDAQYLLFASASFSYSVITLYMFLDIIPMDLSVWLGIVHTGGSWCTYFLVAFILRATDRRWPTFERGLLVVTVLATIGHFIYPERYFFIVAYGFHLISIGALFSVGATMLVDSVRHPGGASSWISVGYIGLGALVAHDWYYFILSPPEEYVQAQNMMQLGIPLLLIVLFIHLVNRFVNALDESEALNRTLEARVAANRRALEASYAENRRMELLESAAREREKIYRDLHDDVGSKLVNIVHASDSERDVGLARSALESLREAIYRANYQDQPANQFVSDLREEMEIRLGNAGLDVSFEEQIEAGDRILESEFCYHVSRICRELVSNVLHHSQASRVEVSVRADGDQVECMIRDDGIGMDESEVCSGAGIKNVRHRVAAIGGDVCWQSEPGLGTQVKFSFPIADELSA